MLSHSVVRLTLWPVQTNSVSAPLWVSAVPIAYSACVLVEWVFSRSQVIKAGSSEQTALDKPYIIESFTLLTICWKNTFVFKQCVQIFRVFTSVFCLSEPFTLLHTRNLKRCSMGCLYLTVEWCTWLLLVLQVRHLHDSDGNANISLKSKNISWSQKFCLHGTWNNGRVEPFMNFKNVRNRHWNTPIVVQQVHLITVFYRCLCLNSLYVFLINSIASTPILKMLFWIMLRVWHQSNGILI